MLLAIAVWAAVLIHQNPMLIFGALLGGWAWPS